MRVSCDAIRVKPFLGSCLAIHYSLDSSHHLLTSVRKSSVESEVWKIDDYFYDCIEERIRTEREADTECHYSATIPVPDYQCVTADKQRAENPNSRVDDYHND